MFVVRVSASFCPEPEFGKGDFRNSTISPAGLFDFHFDLGSALKEKNAGIRIKEKTAHTNDPNFFLVFDFHKFR